MATYYSNQWVLNPINGVYEPVAAKPNKKGEAVTVRPTFSAPVLAAADVINVCPVPLGARFAAITQTNADLDTGTTVTFNFGNNTSATVFGSALTWLQSAATNSVTAAVLDVANNLAVANDVLKLTIVGGPSTTAGAIDWIITFYQ